MKIPKYWAHSGKTVLDPEDNPFALQRWQWSDISVQDAQQQADAWLVQVSQKVLAGEELNRYSYGDRPLREETVQAVNGDSGQELGVITRNVYGALVLNTARAMFIDIDFDDNNAGASLAGTILHLFGSKKPTVTPEQAALENIRAFAENNKLGMVVYRTAGGLRGLVTSDVFEPGDASAKQILTALHSDPLYIRLCQAQDCFRARLTPKPWRIGMDTPPTRFPWLDVGDELRFRQWAQQYDSTSTQYTTCRRVQQFGPQTVHPEVARIIELHDRMACTGDNLTLA